MTIQAQSRFSLQIERGFPPVPLCLPHDALAELFQTVKGGTVGNLAALTTNSTEKRADTKPEAEVSPTSSRAIGAAEA